MRRSPIPAAGPTLVLAVVLAGALGAAPAAPPGGAWLDARSIDNWNVAGAPVPRAPEIGSDRPDVARCATQVRAPSTREDRAVTAAGWWLFGAFQVYGHTSVITADAGVDGMCRPLGFQAFVFVDGKCAGTLSPAPMNARTDGAEVAIRLVSEEALSVDYQRYSRTDPLCCPARMTRLEFHVEKTAKGSRLVPGIASTSSTAR